MNLLDNRATAVAVAPVTSVNLPRAFVIPPTVLLTDFMVLFNILKVLEA